jgi:hypothetical protein
MIDAIKDKVLSYLLPNKGKQENEDGRNRALLDLIAPTYKEIEPEGLWLSGAYRSISTTRNIASVPPGWADNLYAKGCVTTFTCKPINAGSLRHSIDNDSSYQGVRLFGGGLFGAASASQDHDARTAVAEGDKMLDLISTSKEAFFSVVVYQMYEAKDKERLKRQRDATESVFAGRGITLTTAIKSQGTAFWAASPLALPAEDVEKMSALPMPATTIMSAFPMFDSSIDDGRGVLLGTTDDGAVVRLALNENNDYRSNSNIAILGDSGKGKTWLGNKIVLKEFSEGSRIIWLDPEAEGIEMCRAVCGQRIDMSGGRGKRSTHISPFQPRCGNFDPETILKEDDNALENIYASDTEDVLKATLTFLHGFFQIVWGLDQRETPYLDNGLIEAYRRYGIDFDTTAADLIDDQYPVMDDLYDAFKALEAGAQDEGVKSRYREFAALSQQASSGIYGSLWNHRTDLDMRSDFVLLDAHGLDGMEDHIKTGQLYSMLSWVWTEICKSRVSGKKIRVRIGETHMYFGGGTGRASTFAAAQICMIAKRIRKYNGGLMIDTHQVVELLDAQVRRYGEALVSLATYRFFLGSTGPALNAIAESFCLTDTIKDKIAGFVRGQAVVFAGNEATVLNIKVEPFEKHYFGKAA